MIILRLILSESSHELLDALGSLINAIDDADSALLEDRIREANERLKRAMLAEDSLYFDLGMP